MWDNQTYQILQNIYNRLGELLTQVNANGQELEALTMRLNALETIVTLLSLIGVSLFGIFAFYVLLKWCKR